MFPLNLPRPVSSLPNRKREVLIFVVHINDGVLVFEFFLKRVFYFIFISFVLFLKTFFLHIFKILK